MIKEHCCEKLKGLYDIDNNFGPNFRVIKISNNFINQNLKRGVKIEGGYRYLITNGYENLLSSSTTILIFIEYCPFCGGKLSEIYNDDKYINEENHIW